METQTTAQTRVTRFRWDAARKRVVCETTTRVHAARRGPWQRPVFHRGPEYIASAAIYAERYGIPYGG